MQSQGGRTAGVTKTWGCPGSPRGCDSRVGWVTAGWAAMAAGWAAVTAGWAGVAAVLAQLAQLGLMALARVPVQDPPVPNHCREEGCLCPGLTSAFPDLLRAASTSSPAEREPMQIVRISGQPWELPKAG